MNPWRSCGCQTPPILPVLQSPVVGSKKGMCVWYPDGKACKLTLGFSTFQLLTAWLTALSQLPSEMVRTVGCADLLPGPGWLQDLLLLCNWSWRTEGEKGCCMCYKNQINLCLFVLIGELCYDKYVSETENLNNNGSKKSFSVINLNLLITAQPLSG